MRSDTFNVVTRGHLVYTQPNMSYSYNLGKGLFKFSEVDEKQKSRPLKINNI